MVNLHRLQILAVYALTLTLTLNVCSIFAQTKSANKLDKLSDVSFSADGKKLLFTGCGEKVVGGCAIHEYDIASEKLRYYQSPKDEAWDMARYSPKGDQIVFVITSIQNERRVMENMQIAVMHPDGKEVRKLIKNKGVQIYPSFSPSGKKIIFARAAKIIKSGKTPATDYDFYSYDLPSGKEQKLTTFKFFMVSPPYYFGSEDQFIFSAEYPRQFPDLREDDQDAVKQWREQLEREYKEDRIYLMKKGDAKLKPWIMFNQYSRAPVISAQSSNIFFEAQAYTTQGKPDGVDYHEYRPDGKHQRITRVGDGTIWSVGASPDGKQVAVIHSGNPGIQFGRRREPRKLILVDIETKAAREIQFPTEAAQIN